MDANHCDVYPRQIPDTETFTQHAQAAGVNSSSHVVVYSNSDAHGYLVSGRGWWTFKVTKSSLNGHLTFVFQIVEYNMIQSYKM